MKSKIISGATAILMALAALPFTFVTPTSVLAQNVVMLQGDITADRTLTPDNQYLLVGGVFVRQGATLTIEAGTTIFGSAGSFLVIAQGARLMSLGDPTAPVVFTSDQPVGQRARGDWGGIILNGRAPLNVPGGVSEGEGGTGLYGGQDPNDNSGVIQYTRVEFGGFPISPDNELNCIAFQGVGAGTTVHHVQAHWGGDDGLEWFGGAVNIKYALSTRSSDDSFDWTDGWQGRAQFIVVQQSGDVADRGIEADNNAENHNFTPRSSPTIYNMTLIGDPMRGTGSTDGMRLRVGTAGTFRNVIVTGFKTVGVDIRDQATADQVANGSLSLGSFLVFGNGRSFGGLAPGLIGQFQNILEQDPQLVNPFDLQNPDFRPRVGSPARNASLVSAPPNDGFFEPVNFIGGVDPLNDWTRQGWTTFSLN